jgi:hypothetical protein
MRSHLEARHLHRTAEYKVWMNMITRCHNPRARGYPRYGARGITVCDRWRESYVAFLIDMGRRPSRLHSIDRIDNDGPYTPQNCRWADRQQQQRNRPDRLRYVAHGQALLLCEWSDRTKIPIRVLWARLQNGWSVERALATRIQHGRPTRCQNGHLLAKTARFEGTSRRCTVCKKQYDARYRKQAIARGLLVAETAEVEEEE